MGEIVNSNLSDQTQFRLKEINEIKNYFDSEIQEAEYIRCFFWLYWQGFDCFICNKWGVSITSFASVIGAPAGIASANFTLVVYLKTGIIKKS